MPEGMPTPEQIWAGDVAFFSIDTDVIQAEGYNFDTGALNQLPRQLPPTMKLQLTEVVANEVIKHRMEPVLKSIQQFESASAHLSRSANLPMDTISQLFQGLTPTDSSTEHFRDKIEAFATRCRGAVLPMTSDTVLGELFRRYFAVEAPFGLKTTKKSEFPDAASLLLLEDYALRNECKGIVVSMDGGWQAFASQSGSLYCAKSLEELTAIFIATSEVASRIQIQIREAIDQENSPLLIQLTDDLETHIADATWDVGNIYSNSGARVEGEVTSAILTDYELVADQTGVWLNEEVPGTWLVEVTALATVEISTAVTIFIWDSIDREELSFGSDHVVTETNIEVKAFLTCSDVQIGSNPATWVVNVEIATGDYVVDVGEVDTFYDND